MNEPRGSSHHHDPDAEAQLRAGLEQLKAGLETWLAEHESASPGTKPAQPRLSPEPAPEMSAEDAEAALARFFEGLKSVFQGIVADEQEAQQAAGAEMRRFRERLAEMEIDLPAAWDHFPAEARARWLAEQSAQQEGVDQAVQELANAVRRTGEEIAEALAAAESEHVRQNTTRSGDD